MKISIVTVCLNAADTIRDAVESVAAQSHPEIEHIVIDGGSKDGTLELLKSSSGRIACLVSEKDEGLYDAMNKGARLCTGEVLGFLNADDFYAQPQTLEHVSGIFRDATIDVCFGDLQYVDRHNPHLVRRHWEAGAFLPGRFASGWAPPHPTFFVRRSVFNAVGGFDSNYKLAADNDLMMRILECRGHISHYLPEVMVKMRNGGQTNKSLRNIIRGNREILSALNANGISVNVWSYALKKLALKINHRFAGLSKSQPRCEVSEGCSCEEGLREWV
jgi:glycosyltransferase involved in cell wall biosynthesis